MSKHPINLESIFLFILVVIFLQEMKFDNQITQLIAYFASFSLLFCYFIVDVKSYFRRDRLWHYFKLLIFSALLILLVGSTFFSHIYLRYLSSALSYWAHDSVIQTEQATRFLLAGKNPYQEDYFNTPLEEWNQGVIIDDLTNPALYHYAYPPFSFLFSLPFQILSEQIFHWYDQRFILFLSFILTLLILYFLVDKKSDKRLALILLALNPLMVNFVINGLNDIFVFWWIILTIFLLKKRKFLWSSAALALAVLSKQSAWLFLPFYFAYLFFQEQPKITNFPLKILAVFKRTYPFFIISLIFILPFLIWNFQAFWEDTYRYLAGTSANSYPLAGFGFAVFVKAFGWVEEATAYFPFWIPQIILSLPLLYFLWRQQWRDNTLSRLVLNYGVFLLVYWFFSRYFYVNHLGFILALLLLSYFLPQKIIPAT